MIQLSDRSSCGLHLVLKLNSFGPADIIARSIVKISTAPLQMAEGSMVSKTLEPECAEGPWTVGGPGLVTWDPPPHRNASVRTAPWDFRALLLGDSLWVHRRRGTGMTPVSFSRCKRKWGEMGISIAKNEKWWVLTCVTMKIPLQYILFKKQGGLIIWQVKTSHAGLLVL